MHGSVSLGLVFVNSVIWVGHVCEDMIILLFLFGTSRFALSCFNQQFGKFTFNLQIFGSNSFCLYCDGFVIILVCECFD